LRDSLDFQIEKGSIQISEEEYGGRCIAGAPAAIRDHRASPRKSPLKVPVHIPVENVHRLEAGNRIDNQARDSTVRQPDQKSAEMPVVADSSSVESSASEIPCRVNLRVEPRRKITCSITSCGKAFGNGFKNQQRLWLRQIGN
jgi:hypothetical protein